MNSIKMAKCLIVFVFLLVSVFEAGARRRQWSRWEVTVTGADGKTRTYTGSGNMPSSTRQILGNRWNIGGSGGSNSWGSGNNGGFGSSNRGWGSTTNTNRGRGSTTGAGGRGGSAGSSGGRGSSINTGGRGSSINTGGRGTGNGGGRGSTTGASSSGGLKGNFIRQHNDWRNKEGVNLPSVSWDEELARLAQGNVNRCRMKHDSRGKSTSKFNQIGQNLYWTSRTVDAAEAATLSLGSWMSEKQYYTYSTRRCTRVCGHYTQVVWKTSTSIGCAIKNCSDGTYVACNYGPPGNWRGERPY